MLLRVVLIHDAEGVQAHFQLHGFPAHAPVAQALDEGGREVQAGRGRGGRAFAARVHGLVQLLVAGVVLDVGRKRRVAHRVQRFVEGGQRRGQARDALALLRAVGPVDDFRGQRHVALRVGEVHHGARARLQALARTHQHLPQCAVVRARLAVVHLAQQEHLGRSSRAALRAQQARGHDARLVDDEQVVRTQVVDDVAEDAVLQLAGDSIHDQQAAAVALGGGLLRDQLGGQFVIEIRGLHACVLRALRYRRANHLL